MKKLAIIFGVAALCFAVSCNKNEKGEVIPQELVDKINNSLKFNQGFMTTELCAASILDDRHDRRQL